jgi:hypothetical protein
VRLDDGYLLCLAIYGITISIFDSGERNGRRRLANNQLEHFWIELFPYPLARALLLKSTEFNIKHKENL